MPARVRLAHDGRHARMRAVMPARRQFILAPAFVMRVRAEQSRFGGRASRPGFGTKPSTSPALTRAGIRRVDQASIAMRLSRAGTVAMPWSDTTTTLTRCAQIARDKPRNRRPIAASMSPIVARVCGESGPKSCAASSSASKYSVVNRGRVAAGSSSQASTVVDALVHRHRCRRSAASASAARPGWRLHCRARTASPCGRPAFSASTQIGSPPHQRPSPTAWSLPDA